MKKNINIITALFILVTGALTLSACKEEDEVFPRTRLFRPVLNEDLLSEENTIIVDMGKMKEAVSYTLEVSRDTFKTIEYTIETDTNYVVINEELVGEELLWFTIYQVRAIAHADDAKYDSKISDLGNVRTQKFPSNQGAPTFFDVTDVRARVFWATAGEPVTHVKVFGIEDERRTTPLLEFEVTDEEREAEEKIISGLDPLTEYQIAIYSNGEIRGWEIYTTKTPEPSGDNVIDLKGIYSTSILADTLPEIPGGSIVILESGLTYEAGGYEFDKSITLRSGYGFSPNLALINCSSNFNLADGSSVDSIVFKNIAFEGDFGGNYVFNIDNGGTIGEIKFDGCEIHSLRGITRIKDGAGTIGNFSIVNSVVDSINGYGVFYVDTDTWTAGDVLLKNSTFSKCQYFLASRSNTNSITIESCTINEAPEAGRQMFRWRGDDGNNNVLSGVKIYNTIWGPGWDMEGSEEYGVKGVEGMESTNFDIINTYTTSDFSFSGDEIPGFPSMTYNKTAADLWMDPYSAVDFNIKDTGFSGKGNSGDPRWRIGL